MHTGKWTNRVVLICITFAAWAALAWLIGRPYVLPSPEAVLREVVTDPYTYLWASLVTTLETLGGLLLGTLLAVLLAMSVYFVPWTRTFIFPYSIGLKSTPIIAIAPLLTIWFGPGYSARVLMAAIISFFPVLQGVWDGLRSAPAEAVAFAHVLGARPALQLRYYRFHFAMPMFMSSLKVAAPLAVVGAVVSELLSSNQGLGHIIFANITRAKVSVTFATIIFLVVIGWVFYASASALEHYSLRRLKMERGE